MKILSGFSNLEKIAALVSTAYLFLSIYPLPMWLIPNPPVYGIIFFCLFIISSLFFFNNKIVVTPYSLIVLFSLLLLVLYFVLPISEPIINFGVLIRFSSLILIILLNDKIHFLTFKYFKDLIVFFSFFSIIIFLITLLGIELPYFRIEGFSLPMVGKDAYYKVYLFVVSSTNTIFNVMGITIARVCGPFLEPGHFAIYIGIVQVIEKILFGKINKILTIAGVLTFSPAYYIILVMIFLFDIFIKKRIKLLFTLSFSLLISMLTLSQNEIVKQAIYYITIGRNISHIKDASLDTRTSNIALNEYSRFSKTAKVYTGMGLEWANKNLKVLSDFRGFIYRHGIIGMILSVLAILIILSRSNFNLFILLFSIAILIHAHRSWMFAGPYIYILLFIGVASNRYLSIKNSSTVV
jgi:hypothetical protein